MIRPGRTDVQKEMPATSQEMAGTPLSTADEGTLSGGLPPNEIARHLFPEIRLFGPLHQSVRLQSQRRLGPWPNAGERAAGVRSSRPRLTGSAFRLHRPMIGPLVPDDLAKIRQLDDLLADRTDIAVAALAKRGRRVARGAYR